MWEQSRPSYLHSTSQSQSQSQSQAQHRAYNQEPRRVPLFQCSAPCLVQFLSVLGRTKIMQVVGQGREGGAVSGVKGSKHTQPSLQCRTSQGTKLQESLSPSLLTLCFLDPDLDRYKDYKDSQGSSLSPPLCVHPTPDTTVAS